MIVKTMAHDASASMRIRRIGADEAAGNAIHGSIAASDGCDDRGSRGGSKVVVVPIMEETQMVPRTSGAGVAMG